MIDVTLIVNDGSNFHNKLAAVDGVDLRNFLWEFFDGNLEEFIVRVQTNGHSARGCNDYVLQDGDSVFLSPAFVTP